MNSLNSILFLLGFLVANLLFAQSPKDFPQFLNKASVSFAVLDLESDEILLEQDKDRLLIPASTMKLVTSILALHHLGKDFQFKTDIGYSGYIDEEGVLQGNLIVTGYGDPTFYSSFFKEDIRLKTMMDDFHSIIRAAGINCINGTIIVDASFYDEDLISPHWLWQDIANYYGGGISGFNFLDNTYKVTFSRSKVSGKLTSIETVNPEIPDLVFDNRVVTGDEGSGDQAYIFGGPNDYSRTIRGTIPSGKGLFSIKGAIPNPPLTFAKLLMDGLEERGIGVYGDLDVRSFTKEKTQLKAWVSPQLISILEIMNHKSVNLFADGLYQYICRLLERDANSTANPLESFGLHEEVYDGETILDGSGLSPRNMLSSYLICKLLQEGVDKKLEVENSLPVLGKEGTLTYWPTIKNERYSVKAKSGSMSGVQTLAGYILEDDAPRYAFAILVNNYSGNSRNVRAWMINQLNDALLK